MKSTALPLLAATAAAAALAACAGTRPAGDPAADFAAARDVIERNCVHCHGTQRLAGMPSFNDTHDLAKLRGEGNWIVPGSPDASRFFQVVNLADNQPGAMPPTGHGISKKEVRILRDWIASGAPIPSGTAIPLTPHGEPPRSR